MVEKSGVSSGVYLIMEKDGEALFLHRNGTGYLDDMHMLPGGGVEPNERPRQATVRETKEEIDVDIDPANIEFQHVMFRGAHDETGDRVDIFFKTTEWDGEPVISEPQKCDDLIWIPLNDLPESVPEYVRRAIRNAINGIRYSEFDWD